MSSKNTKVTRRKFLSQSSKTAAGVFAASALASCTTVERSVPTKIKAKGANERINLAVIGIRGRGISLAEGFAKIDNVRVKTLCDIDENLFAERVKRIGEIQGSEPNTKYDLRRVYDDKYIDAVVIGAPNHWHALATIWACQAGKHVYVEKPCSHNVWEGRKMIEAARKYNRLVQVGFQNRSRLESNAAMKFLHDGKLGKIYMARGLCFKPRDSFGVFPDSKVPAGVHYDLWLGPAPYRPFNKGRFHYNWHWHWDTGNGDTGNQGPHQFDVARWGLNKKEHPVKIKSVGGYYKFQDVCSQETPNTQTSTFEYADGTILEFGTRGLYTNSEGKVKIGNLFFGTDGWMQMDGGGSWKTFFGRNNEPGPSSESKEEKYDAMNLTGTGGGGHQDNFIAALRSGKRKDLTCDIKVGYMSTVLPHLANISYLLGRDLTFDGKKEKFVGDSKANSMLTRKYRKPYVVPDKV
ncbi:MAG: Gfo/Idh/MocA family protein [Planctomycetota bacterium]|jgi:predicted dehydrogenase